MKKLKNSTLNSLPGDNRDDGLLGSLHWTKIVQRLGKTPLISSNSLSKKTGWNMPKGYINPFRRIPDCRKLRVELGDIHDIASSHGISARASTILEINAFGNRAMNRYIHHQMCRLNAAVGRPELFWRIAQAILKRSNVFMILQLNKVLPQWQKKYPLSLIWHSIRHYQKIIRTGATKIDFKRVWIPKADGSQRPLGVPTVAWRMYLGLLNSILVIWLRDVYPEDQHGFYPRRGTLTAWRALMKVIDSRDIYEYDLTKFFDRINIQYITAKLREMGTPGSIAYMLENINRSTPTQSDDGEEDAGIVERELLESISPETIREGEWFNPVREAIRQRGLNWWNSQMAQEFGPVPNLSVDYKHWLWYCFKWQELQWAFGNSENPLLGFSNLFSGVPQGAPTSPLLAGYALKDAVISRFPCVAYADDGVYHGHLPREVLIGTEEMNMAGISYNPDKSGWIKKDGEWQKPLKFLGLVYDGVENEWSASTRRGSKLLFDKWEFIKEFVETHEDAIVYTQSPTRKNRWVDFITRKISGLIQSRMYLGEWDPDKIEQEFRMRARTNSWADKALTTRRGKMAIQRRLGGRLTVFNSSSMACSSILAYQRSFPRLPLVRWVGFERKKLTLMDTVKQGYQDKKWNKVNRYVGRHVSLC